MSKTLNVQSVREGDFFAEPVNHQVVLPEGSEGLLAALQAAVLVAHPEIGTDVRLTLKGTLDGELIALSNDEDVRRLVASSPHDGLPLMFEARAVAPPKTVEINAVRGGDPHHSPVVFAFQYDVNQQNLLEALKEATRDHLHLQSAAQIEICAAFDGSEVAIPGDKALLGILTDHLEPGQALPVVVKSTEVMAFSGVRVRCVFNDQAVTFEFRHSVTEDNLLLSLRHECAGELDVELDSRDELVYVDPQGNEVPLVADGALRNAAEYHSENSTPMEILIRRAFQPVVLSRNIRCTFGTETVTFVFKHSLDQQNVLQELYREAKAELDLMPDDVIALIAVTEEGNVPLKTDREVLELLSSLLEGYTLDLIAEPNAEPEVSRLDKGLRRHLTCTLSDVTAEFELNFVLGQDGLLDFLISECKEALDLFPSETITLAVAIGDDAVPIKNDNILREILLAIEGSLRLEASRIESPSITLSRQVHCTLGDETAAFELRYTMDQPNLLRYLHEECKAELDLLPNEQISLVAAIDGEDVCFSADREVREVLGQLSPGAPLVLRAKVIKSNVAALLHVFQCVVTCCDTEATVVLKYRTGEANLLSSLVQEIRGDFDLAPEVPLSLSATVQGRILPLKTDQDLVSILGHQNVSI
jgi:hypothetical protein